jgi:hypothetical protein
MEKLIVLLIALALVVLGARGTYKAVWNQFFPNEPIVTTPVSTGNSFLTTVPGQNVPGSGVPKGASSSQNQSPAGYATNPNEVGQQAAKATQGWIQGVLNGTVTGESNAHVVAAPGGVYKPTIVTTGGWASQNPSTGKSTGASYNQPYASNKPSWWPSWLPWPGDIGVALAR